MNLVERHMKRPQVQTSAHSPYNTVFCSKGMNGTNEIPFLFIPYRPRAGKGSRASCSDLWFTSKSP